jgi:MFS family permease
VLCVVLCIMYYVYVLFIHVILLVAIACFVFSLATFSTALSNSVWLLIVIRMVMGLGQSVVTPFASGIIAAYFSYESRGIAFSIFNFGTYASFSLSLSLGTFMYDEYGWKAGYFLFGILGMAIALVMPLVMSDCPEETENVPEQGYESSQPLLLGGGGAVGSFSRVSSEGSYYEIEEEYEQEVRACFLKCRVYDCFGFAILGI